MGASEHHHDDTGGRHGRRGGTAASRPAVRRLTTAVSLAAVAGLLAGCAMRADALDGSAAPTGGTGAVVGRAVAVAFVDDGLVRASDGVSRDSSGRPFLFGGERSADVAYLQQRLEAMGFEVDIDGFYGPGTVTAVKRFQQLQGVEPDGVVGTETWVLLDRPRPTTTTTTEPPPPAPTGEESSEDGGDGPTTSTTQAPATTATTAPPAGPVTPVPAAPSAPLAKAVVHLSTQRVDLLDGGGTVLYTFPVSSGANGATPPGSFRVFRRVPRAVSDSDADVSMPWLVNFNGGIGFHGIPVKGTVPLPTPLGQRPVSHGCIRMADNAAKFVFDYLPNGAPVDVIW